MRVRNAEGRSVIGLYTQPGTDQESARPSVTRDGSSWRWKGTVSSICGAGGLAQHVLNDYVAVEWHRRQYLASASPVTDRHHLYPIPPLEIELSRIGTEQRLQQNPVGR